MTKYYMIMTECVEDKNVIVDWLEKGHFKCWSNTGQPGPLSSSKWTPCFIEVVCSDNRFETWFTLKIETGIKELTAGVKYFIKLN